MEIILNHINFIVFLGLSKKNCKQILEFSNWINTSGINLITVTDQEDLIETIEMFSAKSPIYPILVSLSSMDDEENKKLKNEISSLFAEERSKNAHILVGEINGQKLIDVLKVRSQDKTLLTTDEIRAFLLNGAT